MKIKLDENLSRGVARLFEQAGHDVSTVPDQDLCSSSDHTLIGVCRDEGRCLVSLDLDFGNPLVFDPSTYPGIAVLRLPPRPDHGHVVRCAEVLIDGMQGADIEGRLWIVETDRIREYSPGS